MHTNVAWNIELGNHDKLMGKFSLNIAFSTSSAELNAKGAAVLDLVVPYFQRNLHLAIHSAKKHLFRDPVVLALLILWAFGSLRLEELDEFCVDRISP